MKNWRGSLFAWLVGCSVVWLQHWAETNVTLVSGTVKVIPSFSRVETYSGHTRNISKTYLGQIWDMQGDPSFLPPSNFPMCQNPEKKQSPELATLKLARVGDSVIFWGWLVQDSVYFWFLAHREMWGQEGWVPCIWEISVS